jgi:hypothetical protein
MPIFKKHFALALPLLLAISAAPQARAADDGLYASAPPPGSAFVRFVSSEPVKGNVRGKQFPTVSAGHASPYLPVAQGDAKITAGAASISYDLKPGGHYSAVLTGGKLTVLEEPENGNKLKTQIILINLSKEKDISLKTPDGSTSVIESVEPGKLSARPVNPIKTGFTVYAGDSKIASLDEKSLERGSGYAVVVYDGAKGPAVNYDKASGS